MNIIFSLPKLKALYLFYSTDTGLPDHQLLCLTMDLDQLGRLEVSEVQAMAMAAQDMVLDMVKVHLQPQAMVHLMSLAMVSNKVNLVTNSSIKVNLVSSNRLLFR